MEPEPGRAYPIVVGNSLLGKRSRHSFCSLRYDFKPQSASDFAPGKLHHHPSNKVSVQLPNSSTGAVDLGFQGKFEPSRDDLDCVAVFDGTTFHLELMAGSVKCKNVRQLAEFPGGFHARPGGDSFEHEMGRYAGPSPAVQPPTAQRSPPPPPRPSAGAKAADAVVPAGRAGSPEAAAPAPVAGTAGGSRTSSGSSSSSGTSSSSSSSSSSSDDDDDDDAAKGAVPATSAPAVAGGALLQAQGGAAHRPEAIQQAASLADWQAEFLGGSPAAAAAPLAAAPVAAAPAAAPAVPRPAHGESSSSSSSSSSGDDDDDGVRRCTDDDSDGVEHF